MAIDTSGQQQVYIQQHQAAATALLSAVKQVRSVRLVYDLREYAQGGLTDASLIAAGVPQLDAAAWAACLTAIEAAYARAEVVAMLAALARMAP